MTLLFLRLSCARSIFGREPAGHFHAGSVRPFSLLSFFDPKRYVAAGFYSALLREAIFFATETTVFFRVDNLVDCFLCGAHEHFFRHFFVAPQKSGQKKAFLNRRKGWILQLPVYCSAVIIILMKRRPGDFHP